MAVSTSTLSKREFNSRIVAFISRREISRYNACEPRSSYRFEHVLADIQRYARYNEEDGIPYSYEQTCYGLRWAVETGRVNGMTVLALKALTVRDLIALVYEVHGTCSVIGEIPAYLMAKFTKQDVA